MTPEEILCEFMEPRPSPEDLRSKWWISLPAGTWPNYTEERWAPIPLTLDRLREIEDRLTEEQWEDYIDTLKSQIGLYVVQYPDFQTAVHLSAEQKISALSKVIATEGGRE